MKTYRMRYELYKGEWLDAFTFNAKNDKDADGKAFDWAQYQGMDAREVEARLATAEEATNAYLLHNEYVD